MSAQAHVDERPSLLCLHCGLITHEERWGGDVTADPFVFCPVCGYDHHVDFPGLVFGPLDDLVRFRVRAFDDAPTRARWNRLEAARRITASSRASGPQRGEEASGQADGRLGGQGAEKPVQRDGLGEDTRSALSSYDSIGPERSEGPYLAPWTQSLQDVVREHAGHTSCKLPLFASSESSPPAEPDGAHVEGREAYAGHRTDKVGAES